MGSTAWFCNREDRRVGEVVDQQIDEPYQEERESHHQCLAEELPHLPDLCLLIKELWVHIRGLVNEHRIQHHSSQTPVNGFIIEPLLEVEPACVHVDMEIN